MIENKKIMMLATTDNMIWQFLLPHIEDLQKMGNTVECVCSKTGFWFDELQVKYGLKCHNIDFPRNPITMDTFRAYSKLKKLQEKEKFELIYCQQPVGGLMGRLLGKKLNLPVIYTVHGFHFYKGCSIINKVVYKTVEEWLSKYTDVLITINEEDYQNALKMKAKSVFKINGIGIDNNKMNVGSFDKKEFKKELGLLEDDKVVLTISELNQNKNYETMLKSIKILTEQDKSIKFVSCGTGVWKDKIQDMAKQMGIEENCVFLGFRKDVAKILKITDVFMHASHREGLTLSVMEAMSLGIPCVVSNVRGNRDLIVNEKGGYVVDTEDHNAFAEKIKTILTDKEKYSEFSKFNKAESKKYTVDQVRKQLKEIYKADVLSK